MIESRTRSHHLCYMPPSCAIFQDIIDLFIKLLLYRKCFSFEKNYIENVLFAKVNRWLFRGKLSRGLE